MSVFTITGVQDGRGQNGSVPLRLEIRELQRNPDLLNLYILGLDRLQSVDQKQLLSYYQLSGIHGRPYIPWDQVGPSENGWSNGYCTHTSNLFPTWHRPYLAVYEQALYSIIQKIASEYQDPALRSKYTAAAAKFRIPYWDWAQAVPQGQPVLPAIVSSKTVSVVTTQGAKTTIRNPLYSYKFHPLDPSQLPDRPFSGWSETLRYPDNNSQSRNDLVDRQLQNNRTTLRDGLYTLFTSYNRFDWFSNKAWMPGDGASYNSIESIHDTIHGLTGSGGHMGVVDYSAFDPIFWLHHCMVDRAVAIWQALWPNSWVETHQALTGTFTIAQGDSEGPQSPLTPFHSDSGGKFWTSDMSRSTKTFGYAYPETVDWGLTSQQYLTNVRNTVTRLYSRAAVPPAPLKGSGFLGGIFDGTGDEKPLGKHEHPHGQHHDHGLKEVKEDLTHGVSDLLRKLGLTDKNGEYKEWFANIRVKKYALNRSFFVHIFIGEFDPEPFSWSFEPKLVGSHCVFVNDPGTTECSKCKDDEAKQIQVTASIPLTTTLIDCVKAHELRSLSPEEVEPYLVKNLHWRVTLLDDTHVRREDTPDLKLSVVSVDVKQPESEGIFPTWGDYAVHRIITAGRPAGLGDGDDL
ncbi:MAG: hypothetical protein M1839_001396 [Geoglossum umbratile]|nr:MAG: hypothetical protein M1839_001396 [Geoglossum umbratile]